MTTQKTNDMMPKDWTPEADRDTEWQAITALLREADAPNLPGEARWEEMRLTARREAGIGEGRTQAAPVVAIGAESLARPRLATRVLQIAAVAVAAFALGSFLSPSSSTNEAAPLLASNPEVRQGSASVDSDPDKIIVTHGDLPGRVTPTVPRDGVAIPVTSDGSTPLTTPRSIVIRDGSSTAPVSDSVEVTHLLPDFLRTLRAQPDQSISPDAILESIASLLGQNPDLATTSQLRFLRGEVLLLDKGDRAAAAAEYEAVLRLTNDEGAIAKDARSRLASLRD